MVLLDFEVLKTVGKIPRSDEARRINGLLVRLADLPDRTNTLIVFVSHRWLRSRAGYSDSSNNAKYERIIVGTEILKRQFHAVEPTMTSPAPKRILLWIDWACIDQDDHKRKTLGVASLPAYVERSDALLTPIPSDRNAFESKRSARIWASQSSELLETVTSAMYSLDRAMLIRHAHARELFSRGWIRLEEFLGSHVPLPAESFGWFQKKHIQHRRDRPHFFCTPELLPENFLLLLPRLVKSTLRALDPINAVFHDETDRSAIIEIMTRLKQIDDDNFGYTGPLDHEGRGHGSGIETYGNGTTFRGLFAHGKPVSGVIEYPTGDRYEGAVGIRDSLPVPNGSGEYSFADGDKYVGMFLDGVIQGKGTMYYSWGNVSCGTWANDAENGVCKERFPDGSVFEGEYTDGHKHGRGSHIFSSGEQFIGCWRNRKAHGWGEFTFQSGESFKVYMRAGSPELLRSLLRNKPTRLRNNWANLLSLAKRFPG